MPRCSTLTSHQAAWARSSFFPGRGGFALAGNRVTSGTSVRNSFVIKLFCSALRLARTSLALNPSPWDPGVNLLRGISYRPGLGKLGEVNKLLCESAV